MLPPDLAAFGFTLGPAGSDAALAARAAAACSAHGARRLLVAGAQRWGLLAALARTDLDVTAFDASRAALAQARAGLDQAGAAGRVTLVATDPRDVEIPDGADAALLPSTLTRLLLTTEAQRAALASLRRTLRGPGLLLLDLDRVPPLGDDEAVVRAGPGRPTWRARRVGSGGAECVRLTWGAPGADAPSLDLSPIAPEEWIAEVRAARFTPLDTLDAATGAPLAASSARMWAVARKDAA